MRLVPLVDKALKDARMTWDNIHGIAVTNRPGLLGSLLIGVTVAKTLAMAKGLPLIGINHIEGHLFAPFLRSEKFDLKASINKKFVGLCVSGGHTSLILVREFGKYKILGRTLDDAAGEAFDKFGKVLGFGYPAGRIVDEKSKNGDSSALVFPRPLLQGLDFSFSGLKTAGKNTFEKIKNQNPLSEIQVANLCASYQEAICDVLITKLARAIKESKVQRAVISGGVACNSRLRERAKEMGNKLGIEVLLPPPAFCTDNAAMVGLAGVWRLNAGERDDLSLQALATSRSRELI
jgi:N6-L-threonylcarbamoyladenine synthase